MATVRGETCRVCGEEKTTYVALIPHDGAPPHEYAVGPTCYARQWVLTYGEGEPVPELADPVPPDPPEEDEEPED